MVLLDLPYSVVMNEIEFIMQNENLISNTDVLRKILMVFQDVGRAVNAKTHPLKVVTFFLINFFCYWL